MAGGGRKTRSADGRAGLLVYGGAHFGKSLLWNASSLFFAFFLTEIVGFSPEAMGIVLAVSLFVNAAMDLAFGRGIRHAVQTPQAAGRMQLVGSATAGAAFLAFAATPFLPGSIQIGYALITLLVFRLGYSVYDVPQNAYMALATETDERRAAFAGTRYVAAGASILVIASVLTPLVRSGDPDSQATIYLVISSVLVALSAGFSFGLTIWSRGVNSPLEKRSETIKASDVAAETLTARSVFPVLLVGIFILSSASPLFSKLEAYFTAYALTDDISALGFMISVAVGKVIAQPIWTRLAARASLETVLQVAAGLLFVSGIYFAGASQTGAFGAISSGALYGIAWGGVAMALWSLLARVASADRSSTTTMYGCFTFCSKTAQGLALLGLGHILGRVDYSGPAAGDVLVTIMATGPIMGGLLLSGLPSLLRWRSRRLC